MTRQYHFSPQDCQDWRTNKKSNPKTEYTIDPQAKNGVYKQLQTQCAVYQELAACRARHRKLERTLRQLLVRRADAAHAIAPAAAAETHLRQQLRETLHAYDPQIMQYVIQTLTFIDHVLNETEASSPTLDDITHMSDRLLRKLRAKKRTASADQKVYLSMIIQVVQAYTRYTKTFWDRHHHHHERSDMKLVPYPNDASSPKIFQYTNPLYQDTPRRRSESLKK